MTSFFSKKLRYSLGNEDWRTERQALKLKPSDSVLCITASGDRPLNLLMDNCKEIVCIDANKIQNHLLNLKSAAMQELDYNDYLDFLGATPCTHRAALFRQISHKLDTESLNYWKKNERQIVKGVLYQGAVEKLTKKAAFVLSFIMGKKVKALFDMNDLEKQRAFVRDYWGGPMMKKAFELALHPIFSKVLISDPGVNGDWDYTIKTGSYIYDRMHSCLDHSLANESTLLSLVFKGEIPKQAFSPYLTEEGTGVIKSRLDRISVKHSDVISYLESIPEPRFDCFSLSDVASYLTNKDFIRLLNAIKKAAKPNASFSIRQFTSFHTVPVELANHFVRDNELEKKLEKEDRCFVYRYMVGNIHK